MLVQLIEAQLKRESTLSVVEVGRRAAERGLQSTHDFLADIRNEAAVECALRIRAVESELYTLFGKNKLHGTIHTCIGQEFSGAILGKYIRSNDFVTSNHRCHGHFIGVTDNWKGLIDEIVGNSDGVCAGIGSSQHLWAANFISNGQQGGLMPVAAGVALDRKVRNLSDVVVSFIGEGTLGEGIIYETINLEVLWNLPHIIVCENNFYSQSTSQANSIAGPIAERARGFSIATASADTWDLSSFDNVLAEAIDRARKERRPTFVVLSTYRLNPHSKGDDLRDPSEVEWFREHDPVTLAIRDYRHLSDKYDRFAVEATEYINHALAKPPLEASSYFHDQLPRSTQVDSNSWRTISSVTNGQPRIAQQLNAFYRQWLRRDGDTFFLGEDIADPYGGAFKISKNLTTDFPTRVLTTPISEAAITGIGIGLAIAGRRAFVEIMFGDFITYAFDQIINNASKFHHIYNRKLDCPVIIRTPMGARRGYGPTHSQSLERFLIGIDNLCCISLNSLISVPLQLEPLQRMRCPVILLENKSDYAMRTFVTPNGMVIEHNLAPLPTIRIRPSQTLPTLTILAYGGMARFVADNLLEIFERTDEVPEMIVPTGLFPLDFEPISASVMQTARLLIVEEGASYGSVGAEIVAQLSELTDIRFSVLRVSGKATPIPSTPTLEAAALPSVDGICVAIRSLMVRQL